MEGFKEFINEQSQLFTNAEVINLYLNRKGFSVSEIAQEVGRSEAEIYKLLRRHNIRPNRLKVHHDSVLSLAKVGWDVREIAKATGYTPRNVRYILKNNVIEE